MSAPELIPSDEQVPRFVRSYDGMTPYQYGEWIRLSDYERVCAERDQYKQKLTEAEQLAIRQANEIRSMRRVGLRPFRGSQS